MVGLPQERQWRIVHQNTPLQSGNSLEYTSPKTGEVIKMFRKPWNANKDGALDVIMSEWDDEVVDAVEELLEVNIEDTLPEEDTINENE